MSDSKTTVSREPAATGEGDALGDGDDTAFSGSYLDKYMEGGHTSTNTREKKKGGASMNSDPSESEGEGDAKVKTSENSKATDGATASAGPPKAADRQHVDADDEVSDDDEVPNPYAHYEQEDSINNGKHKSVDDISEDGDEGEKELDDKAGGAASKSEKVTGSAEPSEKKAAAADKEVAGKSETAAVDVPPEKPKAKRPEAGARRIELDIQEHEGHQYTFDAPDPQFFLGAGIVIGLICLLTFFYQFLADYGDVNDKLVPIVTFCGAFAVWTVPFFYYVFTSQHYALWGKIGDGFAGSFPFYPLACGVIFIYFILGRALYYVIENGTLKDKYLLYPSCIVYAIAFFPVFFFVMKLQANNANEYRIKHGIPPIDMSKPRLQTSGCMYMGIMLRRIIVAYVVGVCLAAHMALPAYALGWAAYGLYRISDAHGIWVMCLIVIPPIVALVVLAIIPVTRVVPHALLRVVIMYFWYPIMQWDPRDGTSWVRYDNSLTFERMCDLHNRKIGVAERFYVDGEPAQMEAYYDAAKQDRATMESYGVNLKEQEF